MKQTARKLLSLLMAFAIVLSLAPWALAADPPDVTGNITTNVSTIYSDSKDGPTSAPLSVSLTNASGENIPVTSTEWKITSGANAAHLDANSTGTTNTLTAESGLQGNTDYSVMVSAKITYTYTSADGSSETRTVEAEPIEIKVKPAAVNRTVEVNATALEMSATGEVKQTTLSVKPDTQLIGAKYHWEITSGADAVEVSSLTGTDSPSGTFALMAKTVSKDTNVTAKVTVTLRDGSILTGEKTIKVLAATAPSNLAISISPKAYTISGAGNSTTVEVTLTGNTDNATKYGISWMPSRDADGKFILAGATGVGTARTQFNAQGKTSITITGLAATNGPVTVYATLLKDGSAVGGITEDFTVSVSTGANVYLSFNQSDVSLAVGERKSVVVTVHGMTQQEMRANNYTVRMRPVDGVADKISPYGDPTAVTSGSDTVITWRFDGTAVGSERLYAQLLDRNGNPVTGVSTVYCDVTVTGSSNFTLSDNLTLANTSTATSYGLMRAYLSSVSATDLRNYSVRWTSSNPSVAFFHSSDSISANQGTAVTAFSGTTSSSAYNSDIMIYAGAYSGTATITAQLYYGNTPVSGSTVTRTVTVGTAGLTLVPTPSNTSAVYLDEYWGSTTSGYYRDFSVDPRLNGSSIQSTSSSRPYDVYYTWTLNGYTMNSTSNSNSYRLYSNNQYLNRYTSATTRYNTLVCSVAVYARGTQVTSSTRPLYSNSVTWNVYTGNGSSRFSVSATVYDSNPGYALTDTPDEGNTGSIASQIDTWVRNNYYYGSTSTGYYRDYQVHITGGTAYESGSSGNRGTLTSASSSTWYSYSDLDRVVFTPGSYVSTSTGSYQISYGFEVRLYNYSGSTVSDTVYGTMIFTVKQGAASGGDIAYSGERGKDVSFDVSDFERFWTNRYSGGSLTSVTFGTPTGTPGGTVYDSSSRAVGSRDFYVNPSRSENDLNGVYFSPKSSTAGTTRIPFTATGRTRSNSSSTAATLRGTIVITYLSSAANKITYVTASNGTVNLKASDFTSAYRQVTGNTAPSNLTIVFQDVPANGTLTYTDSSRSSATAVRLTSSNIRSRNFTTKSSGSNQLEDVTYTGSNGRSDTISYIAYSGTNAVFTGEVTFNAITTPMDVNVYYTCYAAAGIPLTPANFTSANSAMSNASYVILGTPRTGKLTYNAGPANAAILMTLLGGVTYTPSTATTGTSYTDSFTFRAFNAANTLVASGTVNVTVSLPANTVKPGAITNINQLTDIPAPGVASDWYRPQLTFLINKGVINGKGEGKFGPGDDLAYSEALKFIMNAAGYYETELTGANWAQNYRNRAVQSGWLSSDVNINSKITRDAMAELTAKVLGIPASTNANPFADSTNQWAAALYEKKIVQGTTSGARPNFSGSTMLKRSEMVCLVYNMYQYSGK